MSIRGRAEDVRRRTVVGSWIMDWADGSLRADTAAAIRSYLQGGPVPAGYEELDRTTR